MSNQCEMQKVQLEDYLATPAVILGIVEYLQGKPFKEHSNVGIAVEYERGRQLGAFAKTVNCELRDLYYRKDEKIHPTEHMKNVMKAYVRAGLRV